MNQYQLTVLLNTKLDEKQRKELLDGVSKQFEKLEKEDLWGVRSLSYPIDHQTQAFYAHLEFSCEPGKIASLDKSLKLNEDIIRYLLIRR